LQERRGEECMPSYRKNTMDLKRGWGGGGGDNKNEVSYLQFKFIHRHHTNWVHVKREATEASDGPETKPLACL